MWSWACACAHTHTPHTTLHTHTQYSLPRIPSHTHTHTLSPLSHPSHRMRGDGSNLIRDRKYHLHSYHSCFVGQEFVDWLVKKGEAQNRKEATEIGMQLVDAGVIKHGMSLPLFPGLRAFVLNNLLRRPCHFITGCMPQLTSQPFYWNWWCHRWANALFSTERGPRSHSDGLCAVQTCLSAKSLGSERTQAAMFCWSICIK